MKKKKIIKKKKKKCYRGFFQGVDIGLIGAAFSPVTPGLRMANNLIIGIKNTELIFYPKLKNERFRYPLELYKKL